MAGVHGFEPWNDDFRDRCLTAWLHPTIAALFSENRRWSGRQDLNLRPLDPKSSALPSCATSRRCRNIDIIPISRGKCQSFFLRKFLKEKVEKKANGRYLCAKEEVINNENRGLIHEDNFLGSGAYGHRFLLFDRTRKEPFFS